MTRFLARILITLFANAVGLFVAALVVPGFRIDVFSFITSLLLFTVVEIIFEPIVLKVALKYSPALRGGIALVTTLIGLLLTVAFTSGLQLSGLRAWVLAPTIIWLTVVLANIILPKLIFKKILSNNSSS